MAKITLIRHGICPICNGQTDIKLIQSFPFSEEEISKTEESCLNCKYDIERNFSSSNETTVQSHLCGREILGEKIKKIVSKFLDLEKTGKLYKEEVAIAVRGLSVSEIVLVYEELSHYKEIKEDNFQKAQNETLYTTRESAEFGDLPQFIGDWHDNEVNARDIVMRKNRACFDLIKDYLKEIEAIK